MTNILQALVLSVSCLTARNKEAFMNWHEMEMRVVYAKTLNELIAENPDIISLEADLGKATGTFPEVSSKNPDNFMDVGVAEANMIGISAGLASEGKIPFAATFTSFASRRVYDQIYISCAYANNNVKIVGTATRADAGLKRRYSYGLY